MIRRMAGRVRRELAARLVPRRDSLLNRLSGIRRIGPTIVVILRELSRALAHRVRRALKPDRVLRVGVDIRPFYEPLTGVGWYLFNLIEELAKRSDVELVLLGDPIMTDDGPRLFVSLPAGLRPVGYDLRGRIVANVSRKLATVFYVPLALLQDCDVFFGANFFLPRALSAVARRRVITIHDLTYRRFPELLHEDTLANLKREMLREISRADAVICVSESTRQDVLGDYPVQPSRVVTIHSGIGVPPAKSVSLPATPGHYLLFVSTIEPRKNLDVLLEAFELLRNQHRYDGDLVIVGKVGWKAEGVITKLKTSPWRTAIRHLDYLDRDQLTAMYRGADVFVLPSLYEGFGFPILEAMAAGVPVIAARSSSLPEIGGDAAIYFNPGNASELATAISLVLTDRAVSQALIDKGRRRSAEFRWDKTAEKTLEIFRRVAAP
jgi:glycosyltransferase involved in cell wall biosynthesis